MDNLLDVIQSDTVPDDVADVLDSDYQANMFTIEEASRETGALKSLTPYTKSPYDAALMRLIDSVPMR